MLKSASVLHVFNRIDEDFREHIIKPELIKMICKMYPNDFKDNDVARCEFRDKIIECVDLSQDVSSLRLFPYIFVRPQTVEIV